MQELAKFAWILVLVIFFVGLKAFIILGLIMAVIVILYKINPEWFEHD